MSMHNPPHLGEFIEQVFLQHLSMSRRAVALKLGVAPSTFLRLLKGQSGVSPDMALRLSKGLGCSATISGVHWRQLHLCMERGQM